MGKAPTDSGGRARALRAVVATCRVWHSASCHRQPAACRSPATPDTTAPAVAAEAPIPSHPDYACFRLLIACSPRMIVGVQPRWGDELWKCQPEELALQWY